MDLVMNDLGRLMSCANNEFKSDEQIDEIQKIICRFKANLKEAQPLATVTPKLHLLCAHLVPFLKVNRSWGHVTEQGLKSLHAVINSLIIRFASVRNVEKNAESILKHIGNFNFLYDLGESWFNNI
uniref:Uncharacterized protein n=1 Tax=Caenorhabditis japonica TaxID=281687 RepID=A0A8R1IA26_CAEJA